MAWVISFILAFLGLAHLCVAMSKHQKDIFGAKLPDAKSKRLQVTGWVLITAFLIWTMVLFRWDFGLVIACGVATLCAVSLILITTLRPTMLRWLSFNR